VISEKFSDGYRSELYDYMSQNPTDENVKKLIKRRAGKYTNANARKPVSLIVMILTWAISSYCIYQYTNDTDQMTRLIKFGISCLYVVFFAFAIQYAVNEFFNSRISIDDWRYNLAKFSFDLFYNCLDVSSIKVVGASSEINPVFSSEKVALYREFLNKEHQSLLDAHVAILKNKLDYEFI
jgi:hypothetical protein